MRAFVAARNERRNITKGQKAMAYEKAVSKSREGRSRKEELVQPLDSFSKQLLSSASPRRLPLLADPSGRGPR